MKRLNLVLLATVMATAVGFSASEHASAATVRPHNSHQTMSKASTKQANSGSQQVKTVQTSLKKMGLYTGAIDGVYGAKTRSAVMKFQRSKHLKADGIVGTKTLAAMR
jgi:peptidoglycan hydrolase-like protein with peptidoglycan-binding domain